ncbi:MAG TPA: hypothetical protein VD706_03275 [Candidatus Saccharimonadales bacterium]|nr:hypothetical protein [Candidatus Saccharimonadales bacterium]
MKKIFMVLLAGFMVATPLMAFTPVSAAEAFSPNRIIDDGIFENYNTMSAEQINTWLNVSYPNGCITPNRGFVTPKPLGWSTSQNKYLFGGNVTAGQAIHDVAVLYHVNPQVILATMQKEQSIPSGSAGCYNEPNPATATPMTNQCGNGTRNCTLACTHAGGCMNIAMGYGCPGYCDADDLGFSMQLTLGTWLLRFGQQRAYGNLTGYAGYEQGDENFYYSGPMTPGVRKRSASSSPASYDGSYTTAAGEGIAIANGSTATLYNFTPFISGNRSFFNIFTGWFGTTIVGCGLSEPVMPQAVSMYNPRTYDHFYTSYACEANVLGYQQGYTYEGAAFNTTPSTAPGAVPVWRLYNRGTGQHLWTTSQDDINNATRNAGYQVEGVAFYTAAPYYASYIVWRLYNPATYQHVWTGSQASINFMTQRLGFHVEGVGFYSQ